VIAVAVGAGLLIGVALGAVGGGGSILTVPALVYLVGENAHQATTGSLLVVGAAALAGTAAHRRAGRVRVGAGLVFGVLGIAGSYLGSRLSAGVDPNVLLVAFSGLMIVAAVAMARRSGRRGTSTRMEVADRPTTGHDPSAGGGASGGPAAPAGVTATTRRQPDATGARQGLAGDPPRPAPFAAGIAAGSREAESLRHGSASADRTPGVHRAWPGAGRAARVVAAATVVGVLTGFFGVGGGFVIVPALVLALQFPMPVAVGTSLLVIAVNSATAFLVRLSGHTRFDWPVLVTFAVAAIAGSLAGNRIASALDAARLARVFVVLLLVVAAYMAARSIAVLS